MKIGFFDSGIGGLTVLHEAYHLLPGEEYIFYGDTDHVPYGLKSNDEIKEYAGGIMDFLVNKGADAVVIACNTASSVAAQMLRENYDLPIIAMEPAVKPALETDERILVTATPVTLREEKLKNLIKREGGEGRTDLLPLPGLVEFAEKEDFESDELKDYLKRALSQYDTSVYSAVVLGCTHFNYFKDSFKEFFGPGMHLADGAEGTVKRVAQLLKIETDKGRQKLVINDISDLSEKLHTQYYLSGREAVDEETLGHFMRLHNRLEEMRNVS